MEDITDPKLWRFNDSCWEIVNQSTPGQDFWQTEFDENTCTYDIIYNVNQDILDDPSESISYHLGDTSPDGSLTSAGCYEIEIIRN